MKRSIQLAFLLCGLLICTESYAQPQYTARQLMSGRIAKIIMVGPVVYLGSKDKSLKLQYLSDFTVDDKRNLAKEAGDIWPLFRLDVERGGYTSAIISALEKSKSGFLGITTSRTFNFVLLKDKSGNWRCDSDRTIETPDLVYRKAILSLQKGEYRQAIPSLNQLISLWPNCAEAYRNRAVCYAILHEPNKALPDINKSISLNATSAESYNNRSAVYIEIWDQDKQRANLDKALADVNKALAINSKYDLAYMNRGEILLKVNKTDDAVKDLSTAIGMNPKLGEAYFYRAQAYKTLGKAAEALKDLDEVKALNYHDGNNTVSGPK